MNKALLVILAISAAPFVDSQQHHAQESVEEACAEYKDALAGLILKFIDKLKAHMDVGIPSLGIPPLDPLAIPDNRFSVYKPYQYDVTANIRNSKMEGLKEFNVTELTTSLLRLQVNMSIDIPLLLFTGDYTLRGKLLSFIPLKGEGPYELKPEDARAVITSEMAIQSGHLQVKNMNFEIDMDRLSVNFEGLLGGGSLGSLANSVLNRFGLTLFRRIEPTVHEEIRSAIVTEINDKLKDIPLSELIGGMSPSCRAAVHRDFSPDLLKQALIS